VASSEHGVEVASGGLGLHEAKSPTPSPDGRVGWPTKEAGWGGQVLIHSSESLSLVAATKSSNAEEFQQLAFQAIGLLDSH